MKRWQERRKKKDADRAFVDELAKFANLEYLTDGEHGYDYCIEVPRGVHLHEFGLRLAELQTSIAERFGVRVTALPGTGEYPEAPG